MPVGADIMDPFQGLPSLSVGDAQAILSGQPAPELPTQTPIEILLGLGDDPNQIPDEYWQGIPADVVRKTKEAYSMQAAAKIGDAAVEEETFRQLQERAKILPDLPPGQGKEYEQVKAALTKVDPSLLSPDEQVQYWTLHFKEQPQQQSTEDQIQGNFMYGMKKLPFVRYSETIAQGVHDIPLLKRVEKAINEDDPSGLEPNDMVAFGMMVDKMRRDGELESEKGGWQKTLEMAGDIVTDLPATYVEYAMAGGGANAVGGAIAKSTAAQGAKALIPQILKTVAAKAAQKSVAASLAGQAIKGLAKNAGTAALQAGINVPAVAASTARAMTPEWEMARPDGDLKMHMDRKDIGSVGDWVQGVAKGFGDVAIENISERLGDMSGKALNKMVETSPLLKQFMDSRIARMLGVGEQSTELGAFLKSAGYDGALSEFFEERAGDVMRGATGVGDYGATGQFAFGTPEEREQAKRQFLAEAIAFSIPGIAQAMSESGQVTERKQVEAFNAQQEAVRAQNKVAADEAIRNEPADSGPSVRAMTEAVSSGAPINRELAKEEGVGDADQGETDGASGRPEATPGGGLGVDVGGTRGYVPQGQTVPRPQPDSGGDIVPERGDTRDVGRFVANTGDADVDKAFSWLPQGSKVESPQKGVYEATLPNGLKQGIYRSAYENLIDDPSLKEFFDNPAGKRKWEREYNNGVAITDAEWQERQKYRKVHAFSVLRKDGESVTPMHFVALAAKSPTTATVVEEMLHGVRSLSKMTDYADFHESPEWKSLVQQYSDPNADGLRHDQDIAKALMSAPKERAGVVQKIKDAFKSMFRKVGWDWVDAKYGEAKKLDDMIRKAMADIDARHGTKIKPVLKKPVGAPVPQPASAPATGNPVDSAPPADPPVVSKTGQKSLPGMRDDAQRVKDREDARLEIRKAVEGIDPDYANDLIPYLEKVRDKVLGDRNIISWHGDDVEEMLLKDGVELPGIPEKYEPGSLEYDRLEKDTDAILRELVDAVVKRDAPDLPGAAGEILDKPLESRTAEDLGREVAKRAKVVSDIVFPDGQIAWTEDMWRDSLSPEAMVDKLEELIDDFAYRVADSIRGKINAFRKAVSGVSERLMDEEEGRFQEENDKKTWESIVSRGGPAVVRESLQKDLVAAQRSLKKTRNGTSKSWSVKSEIAIIEQRLQSIDRLEERFGKPAPTDRPTEVTMDTEIQWGPRKVSVGEYIKSMKSGGYTADSFIASGNSMVDKIGKDNLRRLWDGEASDATSAATGPADGDSGSGEIMARDVFGHPLSTPDARFSDLVPISVDPYDPKSVDSLKKSLGDARKMHGDLSSKIVRAEEILAGKHRKVRRVDNEAAERDARSYLGSPVGRSDKYIAEQLRTETIPELERLSDEVDRVFPGIPPKPVGVPPARTSDHFDSEAEPELRRVLGDDWFDNHGKRFLRDVKSFQSLPEKVQEREHRGNRDRSGFRSELGASITYAGSRAGLTEDGMRLALSAIQRAMSGLNSSRPAVATEPKKKRKSTKKTQARKDNGGNGGLDATKDSPFVGDSGNAGEPTGRGPAEGGNPGEVAGTATGGGREPWQITIGELRQIESSVESRRPKPPSKRRGGDVAYLSAHQDKRRAWNQEYRAAVKAVESHRDAVGRAVSDGKPVPAEVLADYPDLQPRKEVPSEEEKGQGNEVLTGETAPPSEETPVAGAPQRSVLEQANDLLARTANIGKEPSGPQERVVYEVKDPADGSVKRYDYQNGKWRRFSESGVPKLAIPQTIPQKLWDGGMMKAVEQDKEPASAPGDFNRDIASLAHGSPPEARFYDNKVHISELYKLSQKDPRFEKMTLEQFKDRLLAARASGDLALSRWDMPEYREGGFELAKKSKIEYLNAEYHLVNLSDTPNPDLEGPAFSLSDDRWRVIDAMREIEAGAYRGALVDPWKVRSKLGMPKKEFDDLVIGMSRDGIISLHRHDFPWGPMETDESRDRMVFAQEAPGNTPYDKDGKAFFIGMAIRRADGGLDSMPPRGAPDPATKPSGKQRAIDAMMPAMQKAMQKRRKTRESALKAAEEVWKNMDPESQEAAYVLGSRGFGSDKAAFTKAMADVYMGEEDGPSFSLTEPVRAGLAKAYAATERMINKALESAPPKRRERPADYPKMGNAEAQKSYEESHGLPEKPWLARAYEAATSFTKFFRSHYDIPEPSSKLSPEKNRLYARVIEGFGALKTLPQHVRVYLGGTLSWIVEPLGDKADLYSLFEDYMSSRDMEKVSRPDGLRQKPFFPEDADIEEVHQSHKKFREDLEKYMEEKLSKEDRDSIMEAVRRREVARQKLVAEAVRLKVPGFDESSLNNEDYYHHMVLQYMQPLAAEADVPVGGKTKGAKAPTVTAGFRRKEDTAGDRARWNTNYLQAENHWMAELATRLATDAWVRTYLSPIDKTNDFIAEADRQNLISALGSPEEVQRMEDLRQLRKDIKGQKGKLDPDHRDRLESLLGMDLDSIIEASKAAWEEQNEDVPDDERKKRNFNPKAEALRAIRQELKRVDPRQGAIERLGRILSDLEKLGFDTKAPELPARLIDQKNQSHFLLGDEMKAILRLNKSAVRAWAAKKKEAAEGFERQIEDLIEAMDEKNQDQARLGLLAQKFFDASQSKRNAVIRAVKDRGKTVATLKSVKDANPDYEQWEVTNRSMFFRVVGVAERTMVEFARKIAEQMKNEGGNTLVEEARTLWEKRDLPAMILPKEVVAQLDRLERNADWTQSRFGAFMSDLWTRFNNGFRVTTLLWPSRFFRRELGNWSTDLFNMVFSEPGIFNELSRSAAMVQYFDSNRKAAPGKEYDAAKNINYSRLASKQVMGINLPTGVEVVKGADMSKDLQEAVENDVISMGIFSSELRGPWSVRKLREFKGLLEAESNLLKRAAGYVGASAETAKELLKSSEALLEIARKIPDKWGGKATKALIESALKTIPYGERREDTVRLAAFLHFKKRLQDNRGELSEYAYSNPELIRGLYQEFGPAKAAARMARDFYGNYRDTSVLAEYLRKYMMPFYRWTETVNSRVWWMFHNSAYRQKGWGNKILKSSFHLGPLVFQYMWNDWAFSDDEDLIASYDRVRGHLVIPKAVRQGVASVAGMAGYDIDTKNPWLIRNGGMLGDFAGQLGVVEAAAKFMDYAQAKNGVKLRDVMGVPFDSVWERYAGSLGPGWKMGWGLATAAAGTPLTFPTGMQPMRTRALDNLLAESYAVGDEYAIAKSLVRPGHAHRDWQEYLGRMGVAVSNAMDNALSDSYMYVDRFKKQQGESTGISILPESQFRDFKYAARREDYESFKAARKRWLEESDKHTYTSFRQMLGNLNPAKRVGAESLKDFEASLDRREFARYELAKEYQERLFLTMWHYWKKASKEDSPEIRQRLQASEDSEIVGKLQELGTRTIVRTTPEDALKAKASGVTMMEYVKQRRADREKTVAEAMDWFRDRPDLTRAEMTAALERHREAGKIDAGTRARLYGQIMRIR